MVTTVAEPKINPALEPCPQCNGRGMVSFEPHWREWQRALAERGWQGETEYSVVDRAWRVVGYRKAPQLVATKVLLADAWRGHFPAVFYEIVRRIDAGEVEEIQQGAHCIDDAQSWDWLPPEERHAGRGRHDD